MSNNKMPKTCCCIIPDNSQSAILVRLAGIQYECPVVTLPSSRLNFFPDYVPHILKEMQHVTQLDMTVMRHLADLNDIQICLLEVQSTHGTLPDTYIWLDVVNEAGRDRLDEKSQVAWNAWESTLQREDDDSTTAPWEKVGWFADAKSWMETQLHINDYRLIDPVNQFKGAWGWSSILTAETDKGTVFFKADYAKPPQEVSVILKLAELWPRNVPRVITADIERSWMLMSDFAGVGLESLSADHYADAVSLYAKIQQSNISAINDWGNLGCADMTPASLLRLTQNMFADTSVLCGGKHGLSREELLGLELKLPQIEEMLGRLVSSALPNTISNEDFRAGNVVVSGGEYIIYDWGSTVISNPMFAINYFLNRMIRSEHTDGFCWRNDLEDNERQMLMSAYLSQWTEYASWDQLVTEFWLCRRLCYLYEAVKCYYDLPFVGTSSPWGANTLAYIPEAMRKLITAVDHQSKVGLV